MTDKNLSRSKKRSNAAIAEEYGQSREEEIKRRRNRLSQRSFRERRLAYINELEETSRRAAQTESDRNKGLSNENAELRNAYLKLRKKVLGVICTLQEISEEVGVRLNFNSSLTATESADLDFDISQTHLPVGEIRSSGEDIFPGVDGHLAEFNNESARTSNNDSSSCPEELSDAHGYDGLKDLFTTSNPEALMASTTIAQSAPVDVVFSENPEGCNEPVPICAAGLTDMPHSTIASEGIYSADHIGQLDATTNPKTQLRDSCYSNHDFLDIVVGNDAFTQAAASQRSQSNTTQMRETHTYFYGASPVPDIWKNTPLFRSISPTSQISNSLQPRFYNSLFLEHVDMLEGLLQQKISQIGSPELDNRASEVIATAVTLFHDYAWEGTSKFWGSCQARNILEAILALRCMPNNLSLARLPLAWRPTLLQLYTPHSCIIDWFPHPGLRDALILNHNNSAILDELFWDCMDCWVVTVEDIATVLTDVDHGSGLIGVWNIIEAMDSSPSSNGSDRVTVTSDSDNDENSPQAPTHESIGKPCPEQSSGWTPMPLDLILSRKDLARDLFYHLNMNDTISNWLFDTYLFEKYRELKYPGYENLVAKGKSFRRPARKVGPTKMSNRTINLYKRAILGDSNQLNI